MVLEEVLLERDDQERKWGTQNHIDFKWFAILAEEVGEAAEAALENDQGRGELREELVQTAAVAVAWIEAIDRRLSVNKGCAIRND